MTDTSTTAKADTPTPLPPTKVEVAKAFIGDMARPFAIYAMSIATAKVIWGGAAADVIGAAGLILVGLYGAKVYENAQTSKHDADVKVAQAAGPTTP